MSFIKYVKDFSVFFLMVLIVIIFASEGFSLSKPANNVLAELKGFLDNIKIDSARSYKNMTVYPLIASKQSGQTYLLLDDSMKDGTIEINEIGSGNVNTLKLQKNESKYPVFIMSGEIVKGAKQDRIISNDIILSPTSKSYNIAVYCVEQGRWVKQTDKFAPSGVVGSNKLRSTVAQKMSQSAVWSEVAKKNDSLGAVSNTSNYRASYEVKEYKEEAAGYYDHFKNLAADNSNYVGVIIKIDNKVSNMDIFGEHNTFESLWPKLLKSYTQDAVDNNFTKSIPDISTAQSFLNSLNNSNYEEIANPGVGNEFTIKSKNIAGSLLNYNNNVAHLALFADSSKQEEPIPIQNQINGNNMQIQQQYQNVPDINRPNRPR
ncbi:MAG: DUF6569 family protein [Cyanobacteriota bacterium]